MKPMRLTGDEVFAVSVMGERPVQKRLADMSAIEVLAVANGFLRAENHPWADALYAWQSRMRQPAPFPPRSVA